MKLDKYTLQINKTIIILVLYKRKLDEVPSFQSLSFIFNQNTTPVDLVVYDNSPEEMANKERDKYTNLKLYYIHDASNPGISKAYNEGYKIARKLNKEWILLLDQDTHFTENLFSQYYQAINDHSNIHLFTPVLTDQKKILSPCKYVLKRGFIIHQMEPGIHPLKKYALLNSGMLLSTVSFEKTGGFNEKIKLDFVDIDFLERFKKYYPDFYLLDYQCKHQFSSLSNKNKKEIIIRYTYYCNSARFFSDNITTYFILMFWVSVRGIRLFFKYKNTVFLKIFIQYYLLQKKLREEHN